MPASMKLIDTDLSRQILAPEDPQGYEFLQALVRLHGVPVGYVKLPVKDGNFSPTDLRKAIFEQNGSAIRNHLLRDWLATSTSDKFDVEDFISSPHESDDKQWPLVTVAVCTRDRTADLARCLDAISHLDYPLLDILVIDNAPSARDTEQLVRESFPQARYVLEARPGLNWARNRAIEEARGEIIAYTDDDVVVDSEWIKAIARVLVENAEVMAVTGLVAPYELETEAQVLFERYGGFGRGFERKWFWVDTASGESVARLHGGAGKFGTGANMAYRRSVFDLIGRFDVALDVGTVTNGGGDLEMFFRVLKEGHALVYEPAALVFHRHRRDYDQLRAQITNNGIGFYSYLVRSAINYPDERMAFVRLGLWWLWWWNIRRLLISFARPSAFPRDLILAELRGSLIGLTRYQKSRRMASRIAQSFAHGETSALASKEERKS
ncbi:MAG TPA: glycosyltransferase family A protein [Blastocatellia bacterium]|nr:glycosyltransferase family A protein [Blastocatellia bacterium]